MKRYLKNTRLQMHEENEREKIAKLKKIDILKKSDIFGEIAILTSLKRTCTIIADSYMMVQYMTKNQVLELQEKAPNIYNSLRENLNQDDDDDLEKRF